MAVPGPATAVGVPAAAGFFGSKALGGMLMSYVPPTVMAQIPAAAQPYAKMAADSVAGEPLGWRLGDLRFRRLDRRVDGDEASGGCLGEEGADGGGVDGIEWEGWFEFDVVEGGR